MTAARIGCLLAAVAAGPPLYELVQSGSLAWDAALQRGVVVAVVCVAGAAAVGRLAAAYEDEGSRRRRLDAAEQAITDTAAAFEAAGRRPGAPDAATPQPDRTDIPS